MMFELLLDIRARFDQRRSRISEFRTGTRSFVLKMQSMFRHEKVFATEKIVSSARNITTPPVPLGPASEICQLTRQPPGGMPSGYDSMQRLLVHFSRDK